MKKETILIIVIALAVGTLGGIIFTNAKKDAVPNNPAVTSAPPIDYQQNIRNLEAILIKEPNNRNALVQLGHNYYDANQPMKAIDVYDKALEIEGNDPDVLTDQGVMYRRIGWIDKAINNFKKANELNQRHIQSLYNLGIVYRDDLGDKEKAKEAWTRYLAISPVGKDADQVRIMIDHMENGH
ncbi:MAG: tetratricopeptide repeat protein [Desulfuromusa sp.]|jgi:tetratricopeptide (TPR) repeat protein|nr:tetratricopeptide repeat protein [Desulfuromusa sp.]